MKTLLIALLALGSAPSAFAKDYSMVYCETGKTAAAAVNELNDHLNARGITYQISFENLKPGEGNKQLYGIRLNQLRSVSAVTFFTDGDRKVQACVSITGEGVQTDRQNY